MRATIILFSEVFGEEKFEYDTLPEARAGFKRLTESCKQVHAKDKIERELHLEGANGMTYESLTIGEEIKEI